MAALHVIEKAGTQVGTLSFANLATLSASSASGVEA
jgi:hypothetical protein